MVYIDWNITNWITIVLMAFLGFMLLGQVSKLYANYEAA